MIDSFKRNKQEIIRMLEVDYDQTRGMRKLIDRIIKDELSEYHIQVQLVNMLEERRY